MAGGLELITPLHAYINDQSTKSFIDVLDYWSTYGKEPSQDQLGSLASLSNKSAIGLNHESYYEFSESFWSALSQFDLAVEWWRYLPETRAIEAMEIKPVTDEIKGAIHEAFASDRKVHEDSKKSSVLFFYAEVNNLLSGSKGFEDFNKYSQEVSVYLNEISKGARNSRGLKPYKPLPIDSWDWVFSTYCQISSNYLIKNKEGYGQSGLKNPSSGYKAEELCIYFSLVYLGLLAIHRVSSLQNFSFPIREVVENIHFTKNEFMDVFASIGAKNEDTYESISMDFIRVWTLMVSAILCDCESDKLVPTIALDVFIDAYVNQSWDIAYEDFEGMLHSPIESMLVAFVNGDKNSETIADNLFLKDINFSEVYKFTSKQVGINCLSLDSMKKLLFENCLNYWDEERSRFALLDEVSIRMVERVNQSFNLTGFPIGLALHSGNEDYDHFRPLPAYYESVSTLAIVLGQPEFSENFNGTNPTKAYVRAATTLHEAGLSDHALVTLGYGLVKICNGMLYETDFSIKEVNAFILKPEIWPRVEKLFLPFLEVCDKSKNEMSFATKIWIKSIQGKFSKAKLHMLEVVPKEANAAENEQIFKMPIWFRSDDESLSRSLKDLKNLADRQNEMTADIWQRYFVVKDLKAKLVEVSQSLESVAIERFSPIHQLFLTDSKFSIALAESGARLRTDQRVDLGWIEFFIKSIQDANKRASKELKNVIEVVNQSDRSLGKIVFKIQNSHEGILNSFQYFRRLDNMYLSHKSSKSSLQMSQSDTNWLYTYAMSDFKFIADLFS